MNKKLKRKLILFVVFFIAIFMCCLLIFNTDFFEGLLIGFIGSAILTFPDAVFNFETPSVDKSESEAKTVFRGTQNAIFYDTSETTGRMIAEAERLSGKQVKPFDAQHNANFYDTDLGQGALIAALQNIKTTNNSNRG